MNGTHFPYGETRLAYSFRSTDDQAQVLSWFADKLKAQGFQVNEDVNVSKGGIVHSHTPDSRRVFNVDAAQRGSAPMFHVELRELP